MRIANDQKRFKQTKQYNNWISGILRFAMMTLLLFAMGCDAPENGARKLSVFVIGIQLERVPVNALRDEVDIETSREWGLSTDLTVTDADVLSAGISSSSNGVAKRITPLWSGGWAYEAKDIGGAANDDMYKVSLVTSNGIVWRWLRENPDGTRSHKNGPVPGVTNLDGSGNVITNPEADLSCNTFDYFCARSAVSGQGQGRIQVGATEPCPWKRYWPAAPPDRSDCRLNPMMRRMTPRINVLSLPI